MYTSRTNPPCESHPLAHRNIPPIPPTEYMGLPCIQYRLTERAGVGRRCKACAAEQSISIDQIRQRLSLAPGSSSSCGGLVPIRWAAFGPAPYAYGYTEHAARLT
jgi:hypothetical protein